MIDEVDFLHTRKHESLLQIDTRIFAFEEANCRKRNPQTKNQAKRRTPLNE